MSISKEDKQRNNNFIGLCIALAIAVLLVGGWIINACEVYNQPEIIEPKENNRIDIQKDTDSNSVPENEK